jgi:hypothetical protein
MASSVCEWLGRLFYLKQLMFQTLNDPERVYHNINYNAILCEVNWISSNIFARQNAAINPEFLGLSICVTEIINAW